MAQRVILATTTGELFHPVRLHYRVANSQRLKQCLEKLRCCVFDRRGQRWCWHYDEEARHLKFEVPREQIQLPNAPIILGAFRFRDDETADLDVRSIERAVQAILFFDKHFPRDVAKLTEFRIVNRLFSAEDQALTPEAIFDRTTAQRPDTASFFDLMAKGANSADPSRILQELERESRRPLPEVELLPCHFYEDGVTSVETTLRLRQQLAFEHWNGNAEVTMLDLIRRGLGIPETFGASERSVLARGESEPLPLIKSRRHGHQRIDWNFAPNILSRDYLEDIDLASESGLAEVVDGFVSDLEENTFRQWESVLRVEQDLSLAPIHDRLYEELIGFNDDDDQILYIDDIERPAQPWYEVLRKIAPRLLVEPLVTAEIYDDFVDRGWFQIAVALENNSRGLSLPEGITRPEDVLPDDLRHKLWLQHCCSPLLGLGQDSELTLKSESDYWRIDQCVKELVQHRDSVAFLGVTFSGLLERCVLPSADRAIFVRVLSERLSLSGPDAPLAEHLGNGPRPLAHPPVERVSRELIRDAILNSETSARHLAARYFIDECSDDPEIARLIIQSIERFGWDALGPDTGSLLADCVHNQETMAWLLARLQKMVAANDLYDGDDDLHADDLVDALVGGDLEFLAEHQSTVTDLCCRLDSLRYMLLDFRVGLRDADPDTFWSSIRNRLSGPPVTGDWEGWQHSCKHEITSRLANDPRMTTWITETLARTIDDVDYNLAQEELAISLAGLIKFQPAIPQLLDYLHEDDDPCCDAIQALIQIGGDDVVEAVLHKAATASSRFLANAVLVIEDIHTPLSAATLLNWQSRTRDQTVRQRALEALLYGFVPAVLEPAWRQVESSSNSEDVQSLRWRFVAVSLVAGISSLESDQWRELAQADFLSEMTSDADDDEFNEALDAETDDRFYNSDESDGSDSDDDEVGTSSSWPVSVGLEGKSAGRIVRERTKVGRNDPCPCGSGKKYKKCCFDR